MGVPKCPFNMQGYLLKNGYTLYIYYGILLNKCMVGTTDTIL